MMDVKKLFLGMLVLFAVTGTAEPLREAMKENPLAIQLGRAEIPQLSIVRQDPYSPRVGIKVKAHIFIGNNLQCIPLFRTTDYAVTPKRYPASIVLRATAYELETSTLQNACLTLPQQSSEVILPQVYAGSVKNVIIAGRLFQISTKRLGQDPVIEDLGEFDYVTPK